MRGMRGAIWALGLAGAAYAWKNRNKLQQQVNSFGGQNTPGQLPDYRSNSGNQYSGSGTDTSNQSQSTNFQPGMSPRGSDV
jgi:hypothetical protein